MDQKLPDEIWLRIFSHLSLDDRIRHVSLVSKRFNALSMDPTLFSEIDFSSAVFMPDATAMRLIRKVKSSVRKLSFIDCHWLNFDLRFPHLPTLHTLDLVGCFLPRSRLHTMLSRTVNLKNLYASVTAEELSAPLEEGSLNPETVSLDLDHLHFDSLICGDPPNRLGTLDILSGIYYYFEIGICGEKRSLSVFLYDKDYKEYFHFMDRPDQGHSELKYIDASLKFLQLPAIGVKSFATDGSNSACRDIYPELQCLVTRLDPSRYKNPVDEKYDDIKRKILFSSSYPKLKCLSISCRNDDSVRSSITIPDNFYPRLLSFQHLQVVNVKNLPVNLNLLLDALKYSKLLHSLSIPLNGSVKKESQEGIASSVGRIAMSLELKNPEFFTLLSEQFPKLKKLEITQTSSFKDPIHTDFLKPIGSLSKLELLCLDSVLFVGSLRNIFTTPTRLKSLILDNVGKQGVCEYSKILKDFSSAQPYLTEIKLHHSWIELSPALMSELVQFKELQKLALRRDFYLDTTTNRMIGHFKTVVKECPRMHMCAIITHGISDTTCSEVRKYVKELKKGGRRIAMFCGLPLQSKIPPSLVRFVDFDKPAIGACNMYSFKHATF